MEIFPDKLVFGVRLNKIDGAAFNLIFKTMGMATEDFIKNQLAEIVAVRRQLLIFGIGFAGFIVDDIDEILPSISILSILPVRECHQAGCCNF